MSARTRIRSRRFLAIKWVEHFANPTMAPKERIDLVTVYPDEPGTMHWGLDGDTRWSYPDNAEILAEWPAPREPDYDAITIDYIRRFKPATSAKPDAYEESDGWISPDGACYPCEYSEHEGLADRICCTLWGRRGDSKDIEQSWLKLSRRHGVMNGYKLIGGRRATQAQLDTLHDLAQVGSPEWQQTLQRSIRNLSRD